MIDYKELAESFGRLDENRIKMLLEDFVASNPSEKEVQDSIVACQKGMAIVGELFEKGEYFVGDLMYGGELMTNAIDVLKPVMGNNISSDKGVIVLGTVAGDLHDIGKNIFKSMVKISGFIVHDLGVDQSEENFVDKIKEIKPNVVGMSGILTISIESMKKTVKLMREEGLRGSVKVIIGGNPATGKSCSYVGADAYTNNAAEGVRICQEWANKDYR